MMNGQPGNIINVPSFNNNAGYKNSRTLLQFKIPLSTRLRSAPANRGLDHSGAEIFPGFG
jgi:hypothetical protein